MPIAYLRPNAVGTSGDGWTIGTAATKYACVDPGPVPDLTGGYSGTWVSLNLDSALQQSFRFGVRPAMASITSLEVVTVCGLSGGPGSDLYFHAYLDGVAGNDAAHLDIDNASNTSTVALPNPRAGSGGVWSVADVLNPTLEVAYRSDNPGSPGDLPVQLRLAVVAIKITYVATPTQNEQVRDIAGRWMNEARRENPVLTLTGMPPEYMDLEIGDEFSIAEIAYPTATGYGAADTKTTRALLRLLGFGEININESTVSLLAVDLHDQLTTFRDSGLANSPSVLADGVLRLDRGQTRVFVRASKAWVDDTDGIVRELGQDVEKFDHRWMGASPYCAETFERASTNGIKNASFRNGAPNAFSNWTPGGTGVNGSSVGDASPGELFDSGVTSRGVLMTAGSPHTTLLTETSDASASVVARRLSIDYRGDSGETVNVRLIRQSDGFFFDDSLVPPDFAAPVAAMTITGNGSLQRFTSALIPSAAANTYVVVVRMAAGGTASRKFRLFHVQLETVPWASTRIVTDAASVTRALETLTISNNSGRRSWDETGYAAFFAVIPSWSSADVATGSWVFPIARTSHDANNLMRLFYDGTAGLLTHHRKAAGTDYNATVARTLTAGTRYIVCIRANGTEQELGLAAYTLSIFANTGGTTAAVKGTDVVAAALATQATVDLTLGTDGSGSTAFDGAVCLIDFKPQVYTDEECIRECAFLAAAT